MATRNGWMARVDAIGRALRAIAAIGVGTPLALGAAWWGAGAWGVTMTADPQTVLAATLGASALSLALGVVGVAVLRVFRPEPSAPDPRPRAEVHVRRAGGMTTGHPWFAFLFPNRITIRYALSASLHARGEILATYEETVHHVLHRKRDADLLQRVLLDVDQFAQRRAHRWALEWPDHHVVLAPAEPAALAAGLPQLEDRSRG